MSVENGGRSKIRAGTAQAEADVKSVTPRPQPDVFPRAAGVTELAAHARDAVEPVALHAAEAVVRVVSDAESAPLPNERPSRIEGSFDTVIGGRAQGWAVDLDAPDAPVHVQILANGFVLAEGLASEPRRDVLDAGIGNGANGFVIPLPPWIWSAGLHTIEARIGLDGQKLTGGPKRLDDRARYWHAIDGFDGPALHGWVRDSADPKRVVTVELLENDEIVTSGPTDLTHELGGLGRFALSLPSNLRDGRAHCFELRVPELDLDLGSWSAIAPTGETGAVLQPVPSLGSLALHEFITECGRTATKDLSTKPSDVETLKRALAETEEDDVEGRYDLTCELGSLLRARGKLSEALEVFGDAVALDDGRPIALSAVADTLLALGRETDALAFLEQQLERLPEEPALLDRRDQLLCTRHSKSVRMLAFYLPQFHPIPENDEWWGRGFTEWRHVAKAGPLFGGHLQPRRPTTLGYYDLRVAETVNQQFDLARRYGIDGFCYYYYWFHGRRVLERPLQDLLDGKTGPFPFCVCWANEDWTRSWDGTSGQVLIGQEHSPESDAEFIRDLEPLLRHPSYVRYDGRLLVLVYRADKLAAPLETTRAWRRWCRERGIGELYLCAMQSFGFDDPRELGFDAAVEFPPHAVPHKYPTLKYYYELDQLPALTKRFHGKVYDYQAFADDFMRRPREPYTLHRASILAWDNTARRGLAADVYHHFSVQKYENWLCSNAARGMREQEEALVFINAWNEWGEGTALEPDEFFGYELLEATRRAKRNAVYQSLGAHWKRGNPRFPEHRIEKRERIVVCGHDANVNGAQINLLNMVRCLRRELDMDVVIFLLEDGPLLAEYEKVAPTFVLGRADDWKDTALGLLRHNALLGSKKAICNTVVTGDLLPLLKFSGYRVISLVHEMPALIESYGLESQCALVAEHADHIVCASKVVLDRFAERYWPAPEKSCVAPQGIVFNTYHREREAVRAAVRDELGFEDNALLVVGCGHGDVRKGIDLFVQMAGRIRRLLPTQSVGFLWIGGLDDPLEPYLRADIERLGLSSCFHVTRIVRDPARYFIAGDVFALTSREDPFPSVVMEAFDARMPVVAFEGGGGYVDIVDDSTGALVPYLDVAALSEAVATLLSDGQRRHRIGNHAHQLCRERFGYAPYMRKLLALLGGVRASEVARGHLERRAWPHEQRRPTITALVPNYNYARYLELRLRTILDQTLPPDEIIVLDDASTDYSLEVIDAISAEASIPIRVVRNESNSGNPFVQWAKGFAMATGELVWIAEADDYSEPTFLETLAKEFLDDRVVMTWVDSIMVGHDGKSSGAEYKYYYSDRSGEMWHRPFRMHGRQLLHKCLLTENVVPNASAVLFRKSAIPSDLSVIQEYRFSGDWWFWISLAERGHVVYRPDALNYHRRHRQSVMGDVLQSAERLLPETMSFYERLARLKPELMTPEVRLRILDRVDALYMLFPELSETAARLREHPSFSAQYGALLGILNPIAAIATLPAQVDVVLAIACRGDEDRARALGLTEQLVARHRVHLLFIGSSADAALFAKDLANPPKRLENAHAGASRSIIDESVDTAPALESLFKDLPSATLVSFGFEADVVVAGVLERRSAPWLVVLSGEYDRLDDRISDREDLHQTVNNIVRRSGTLAYLCDRAPLPVARLAGEALTPLQRLYLESQDSTAKENDAQLRKKTRRPVEFAAIAAGVPVATWELAARALNEAASESTIPAVLRLLTWGADVPELASRFADIDGVEVCQLAEPPTDWRRLGDVGLDLEPRALSDADRPWVDIVRGGLPAVVLDTHLNGGGGNGRSAERALFALPAPVAVDSLRDHLAAVLKQAATGALNACQPVPLKWRLSPGGIDEVVRQGSEPNDVR